MSTNDFDNDSDSDFNSDPYGYERGYQAYVGKRQPRRQGESDIGAGSPTGPDQRYASEKRERHLDEAGTRAAANASAGGHGFFSVTDPWPDAQRAAPRELLQCGLMGIKRRGREILVNRRMDTNANVQLVIVEGETLFQIDLDSWMSAIHLGRHGGPIRTTPRELLALSGRARGGNATNVLRRSLERLIRCRIKLEVRNKTSRSSQDQEPDRYGYEGLLIDSVTWNETEGWIDITLNPDLGVLFEPHRRTVFLASKRAAIGDHPVALWMYGVLRCHRTVLPRPLAYYHRMCGSNSCLSDFADQLQRALSLLAKEQLLFSAEIRRGMLFVQRERPSVPTPLPQEDTKWFIVSARCQNIGYKPK